MIDPQAVSIDPQVYRRAAEVIRESGLAKGIFKVDPDNFSGSSGAGSSGAVNSHCTVGAILEAVHPGFSIACDHWDTMRSYAPLLGEMLGSTDSSERVRLGVVTDWNDNLDRTAEDVVTLLEQAAEKLEAEL